MEVNVVFKDIKKEISTQLLKAEKSIKLAVAWLTDEDIIRVLSQRQENGISVQVLICDSVENFKRTEKFNNFLRFGGGLCIATSPFMHHKFCIIDEKIILNGSYNWSYPAQRNNENLLTMIPDLNIRQDKLLLLHFVSEFITLYKKSNTINQTTDFETYKQNSKNVSKLQSKLEVWEIELRQEFENEITNSINQSHSLGIMLQYTPLLERMKSDGGGVYFAKRLIHEEIQTGKMKPGFKKLEEHFPPQIKLSIEYLVAHPKYQVLFSTEEVDFCSFLMRKYNINYD